MTTPSAEPRPAGLPRSLHGLLVVAGLLAIAGLVFHNMDLLGDGFWYVASGRWLLDHRALPHADPFSFASVKERWIVGMPGACLLFALVADHLGLRALLVMGTIVEAAAVALLWLRAARTPFGRLVLLLLALFFVQVDATDLSVRGQVFGDLGFVLLLGMLARLRDGQRVHPLLVVLGAAVWANLHYSFLLLFFVPLGAAALLLLEPEASRPRLRPFVAVVFWAFLGSLINPYGWRYLAFSFHIIFTPIADDFAFFRSPDFHDPAWLVAPACGVAILVLRGRYGESRCAMPEQALLLVFVAAACNSLRWGTLLVAVEMGLLGPMLDRYQPLGVRQLSFVAAVASGVCAVLGVRWISRGADPLQNVPVAAAEVARAAQRAQYAAGRSMDQVVNPLHWGGYLAYEWNGDPKYFHDGRDQTVLFDNGVYEDAGALWKGTPRFAEVLDVYEAGVVLWERGSRLDLLLRGAPGWKLAHEDAIAVVHVRTK